MQHFQLIVDCNDENVSTRQCQLLCRRKYLRSRCATCRPSTLADQLLGVNSTRNVTESGQRACTIKQYNGCYPEGKLDTCLYLYLYIYIYITGGANDTSGTDASMQSCLASCKPACDYWEYELTHDEIRDGRQSHQSNIEYLIVPLNDYVEFTQSWAYTWYKAMGDIGGLLYV